MSWGDFPCWLPLAGARDSKTVLPRDPCFPLGTPIVFILNRVGDWTGIILPIPQCSLCSLPFSLFFLIAVTVQTSSSKNVTSKGFCLKPILPILWPSGKCKATWAPLLPCLVPNWLLVVPFPLPVWSLGYKWLGQCLMIQGTKGKSRHWLHQTRVLYS
jgi:hypothetical protein